VLRIHLYSGWFAFDVDLPNAWDLGCVAEFTESGGDLSRLQGKATATVPSVPYAHLKKGIKRYYC